MGRPALMAKIRIVLPHARSGYSRPGPWSAPRIDRLAGDGGHKIAAEMAETSVKGLQHLEVRDDEGEKVAREIKFKRIIVLPPIGKQKRYPSLDLTVIHASERGAPKGRKPIEWKLDHGSASAQPCRGDRGDKLAGQALENRSFPKILKSGCKAAESKLRTAERLAQPDGWRSADDLASSYLGNSQFAHLAFPAPPAGLSNLQQVEVDGLDATLGAGVSFGTDFLDLCGRLLDRLVWQRRAIAQVTGAQAGRLRRPQA